MQTFATRISPQFHFFHLFLLQNANESKFRSNGKLKGNARANRAANYKQVKFMVQIYLFSFSRFCFVRI